ncbi:MAG: hypothetical protein BJ554DRAFT_1798, partial [Olpidium bornovanus]
AGRAGAASRGCGGVVLWDRGGVGRAEVLGGEEGGRMRRKLILREREKKRRWRLKARGGVGTKGGGVG